MDANSATFNLPLAQADIRQLIPHAGAMCLLERVLRCDERSIECEAVSHRALDNPLRHQDRLPIHAGIEYCAQAIAVHGGLTNAKATDSNATPRRGYLAIVTASEWTLDRLDTCEQPLRILAHKVSALPNSASYAFAIEHAGRTVLTGQAVVALE